MTVPAFTELYRLEKIVAECFPDGSVTVAALRREIQKGRLDAWRLAGKDMTTKDAVARMLEKCRVKPARRASGTESQDEPKPEGAPKKASGSSSTTDAKSALVAARKIVEGLKQHSQSSSPRATKRRGGNVVSMKFR